MRVAIIDNGVATELVDCYHEVDLSEGNISEKEEMEKYGHGTICAAIIKKWIMDEDEKQLENVYFYMRKSYSIITLYTKHM